MSKNIQLPTSDDQALTSTPDPEMQRCPCPHCPLLIHLPDDGVILAWLDAKTGHTQSWQTHVSYHRHAVSLRTALSAKGYDLLMDLSQEEVLAGYLQIVQHWAGTRLPSSHFAGPVSPTTYNHALACISSLFAYARKQRLYKGGNPIDLLERRKVHPYAGAQPIP